MTDRENKKRKITPERVADAKELLVNHKSESGLTGVNPTTATAAATTAGAAAATTAAAAAAPAATTASTIPIAGAAISANAMGNDLCATMPVAAGFVTPPSGPAVARTSPPHSTLGSSALVCGDCGAKRYAQFRKCGGPLCAALNPNDMTAAAIAKDAAVYEPEPAPAPSTSQV